MVELKSKIMSPKRREQVIKDKDLNVTVLGPPKKKRANEEEENSQ